jgi:Zn-dependent protease
VFLLEPEETRYDLRWRMLGTRIRVHPMFWLMSLVLGYNAFIPLGVGYLLLWVVCVFASVLLHEFGHVWAGRLFGSHGHIVLYSFGGLAIGSNALDRRWQRIVVLLAGPGIQLALYALIHYSWPYWLPSVPEQWRRPVALAVFMLEDINLIWPILNLLPIWPLDGGQITREVCQAVMPARGTAFSLGISMVVSGFLAIHMFMATREQPLLPSFIPFARHGDMFLALFFALFCVSSFMALQAENQRRRQWSDDDWPWQR